MCRDRTDDPSSHARAPAPPPTGGGARSSACGGRCQPGPRDPGEHGPEVVGDDGQGASSRGHRGHAPAVALGAPERVGLRAPSVHALTMRCAPVPSAMALESARLRRWAEVPRPAIPRAQSAAPRRDVADPVYTRGVPGRGCCPLVVIVADIVASRRSGLSWTGPALSVPRRWPARLLWVLVGMTHPGRGGQRVPGSRGHTRSRARPGTVSAGDGRLARCSPAARSMTVISSPGRRSRQVWPWHTRRWQWACGVGGYGQRLVRTGEPGGSHELLRVVLIRVRRSPGRGVCQRQGVTAVPPQSVEAGTSG